MCEENFTATVQRLVKWPGEGLDAACGYGTPGAHLQSETD